jgi:hypothetical protein
MSASLDLATLDAILARQQRQMEQERGRLADKSPKYRRIRQERRCIANGHPPPGYVGVIRRDGRLELRRTLGDDGGHPA